MKIKLQPHQYILAVVLPLALIPLGMAINHDKGSYAMYAIAPLVISTVTFVLSPQINWWWYKRHPLDLTPLMRSYIEQQCWFYKHLNTEEKLKFRQRVAMYTLGNEFMRPAPLNEDVRVRNDVPEDIKVACASCAVQITFNKEDYMLAPFEQIVIYPSPFPSPQYPSNFHTSEMYIQDGVLLFSAEHLVKGVANPDLFFNIGLYEYARVFVHLNPKTLFPKLNTSNWSDLERISNIPNEAIKQHINLPELDILGVAIHHYFIFPELFKKALPDVYQMLKNEF
jgi:hypothetical protein